MTDADLRLVTVHAHPDDEASKGAALVAKYRDEGVASTLVCCTGGELGSILNPALERPEIVENLAAVRQAELEESVRIIGFDQLDMLGYLDSGMPDMPENADPRNFWNAPIDEAVERLVRVLRRDRPQVVITYSDEQGHYPHPDHLRVHDATLLAYERAGDADWYPDSGEPFAPSKLYYSQWSAARIRATHEKMVELGIESPYPEDWLERADSDHRITTRVHIGDYWHVRDAALRAHATQVEPESPFWFGLPPEIAAEVYPWDDYVLARSSVDVELIEDDLFAGIR